ncbi:MAG TPA: N,N-dimethylformamidase beta subunit family domain-containing protein [Candidatus Nitrosotalea sp.]|nr:N,N-dimethylformamidase beta subunit family domain-containing protein [Candidatus Nitrosotalea sp.]
MSSLTVIPAHAEGDGGQIPSWTKMYARWWAEGKIADNDFLNGTVWMVENNEIPESDVLGEPKNQLELETAKKIALDWSQNKTSDSHFLYVLEYLAKTRGRLLAPTASDVTLANEDQVSVWREAGKSVVVIPVFTEAAYWEPGFYTYYRGQCSLACLTIHVDPSRTLYYTSSYEGAYWLERLGYSTVTDIDVDKNPSILKKYDKVIVLHNEYVTQKEFDAITSHPHVVYLYPNSLYALVNVDYKAGTITLVRGHNYPQPSIVNGFGWKYDHSKMEYDTVCKNWDFMNVGNGVMLNCYPEYFLPHSITLLRIIKDY